MGWWLLTEHTLNCERLTLRSANGVVTTAPMASAETRRRRLGETTMGARELKCSPQGLPMLWGEEMATLARHSGYRVKSMAHELGRSCRWLEIHCHRRFALTPHAWLVRLRAEEIQKQARTGARAKVLCQQVGFADAASFCHGLKRCMGCTFRELRELGQNKCSRKDNKNSSPPTIGTRENSGVEKDGRCQHETLTLFSRRPASSEV
jgi:AraC-like DNA-binding protein